MPYDNVNEGVLFNCQDKKSKETDRDYSGNLEVRCPHCNATSEHWLSSWINKSAGGKMYMKLKLNFKEARQQPTDYGKNEDGTTKPPQDDGFDDIPF